MDSWMQFIPNCIQLKDEVSGRKVRGVENSRLHQPIIASFFSPVRHYSHTATTEVAVIAKSNSNFRTGNTSISRCSCIFRFHFRHKNWFSAYILIQGHVQLFSRNGLFVNKSFDENVKSQRYVAVNAQKSLSFVMIFPSVPRQEEDIKVCKCVFTKLESVKICLVIGVITRLVCWQIHKL